jgi:hypothetical protein
VKIIETKSSNILSKLIRWAFNSKGSHIAFVFDDDKWLVHSNLLGVNIRLFKAYMNHHSKTEIVESIEYDLTLDQEEEVFQTLISQCSEDSYDYPGFIYFAWRGLLYKLFDKELPLRNAWGKADMQLCTEMIFKLPPWITKLPEDIDLGMTTPDKAMIILKGAK